VNEVEERLRSSGMSEREARTKAELHARCDRTLTEWQHGGSGRASWFVPGRVELFGKHTDYAGAESLLCAVERGVVVVAATREDGVVRLCDVARGEIREMKMGPDASAAAGDWAHYAATVISRIARNFPAARRGADIAFASDLPPASGMSSSSALMIAFFHALDAANGISSSPVFRQAITSRLALAEYLATIENGMSFGALVGDRGVGTFGGSEDHTAILCCRAGYVSRYAFCPTRAIGDIAFPRDHVLVLAHSGVSAEKTGDARASYNEASLAVREILRIWNDATGERDESLAAACGDGQEVDRVRHALQHAEPRAFTRQRLLDRLAQFVSEAFEIIPEAARALERGDIGAFGAAASRSQSGAEGLLGNQIAETVALVRMAHEHGAAAASAFGAGFGGSVWALVPSATAARFEEQWRDAYGAAYPAAARHGAFFSTRAGPSATEL